jgi:hypothetical protein
MMDSNLASRGYNINSALLTALPWAMMMSKYGNLFYFVNFSFFFVFFFTTRYEPLEHQVKVVERASYPRTCIHCGRIFKRTSSLTDHKKKCSDFKFPCVLCGQKFGSNTQLTVHKKQSHKYVFVI